MRPAIRLLGPALLPTVLAVGCAASPPLIDAPAKTGASSSGAISIKGFAFNPVQLSATKGATITWTNDDGTTHTVTSGVPGTPSGKFNQTVDAGKTFSFTFTDTARTSSCSIHNSMRGTVSVT